VCYTAFVHQGGGVFSSTAKAVSGRPFDVTAGRVKWAYNVGMAAIVPPGNGVGVIHAVAQDQSLHSVRKDAAGGTWPAPWIPQPLNGPSQGRPSTVVPPGPILGASRLIFLGSQGGSVYAINADTGNAIWNAILPLPGPPAPVQAAPSGYFTFFGGTRDYILVGTRGAGALNRFYALKLADGTVGWSYDGSADGLKIGVINGQATADYASRRVYFASAAFGAGVGEDQTVWCLDLETGARVWSAAVGNVMGSPIVRNGRLYVASYNGITGGEIHALNASDGSAAWLTPFLTGLDGPVKLFVGADRTQGQRLLFSTTSRVWALDDAGGSTPPPVPTWVRDPLLDLLDPIPNPSSPVFLAGGPHVYVGSSNGKVYRLDYDTGATLISFALGDPLAPAAVGSPTLDLASGFLYVGTEAGIVYCVQY
jgi:outer membrane protein assembly factor BamB